MSEVGSKPVVSFIIAVYNGEKYIREAVESCLNQTYPEVEVVVTDDGSTDGTLSVLKTAFSSNPKVKIFSFPDNRGKVAAFNHSFAHSTGAYIAFTCGDDVNFLERAAISIRELEARGAEMVCSDCLKLDGERRTSHRIGNEWFGMRGPRDIDFDALVRRHIVFGPTMFLARTACETVFPMPEMFRKEDSWVALAAASRQPIAYIDQPLVHYRIHDTNTSWVNPTLVFQTWINLWARELPYFYHAAKVFQMTPTQEAIWTLRTRILEMFREDHLARRLAMTRNDWGKMINLTVPLATKLRFLITLASPKLAYQIAQYFMRRLRKS